MFIQDERSPSERQIIELTSFMMHKHYCENDVEPIIALMDDDIVWIGAAEQEYAIVVERVASIFRQFVGQVPKCNIGREEYDVLSLGAGTYLSSSRMWIETDASTQISLRVHQRFTMIFRWKNDGFRCCHIHISNPYSEMTESDAGFPTKMALQSYYYLQEQIEKQKKQIAAETQILERKSYEDILTGVYNRNKFNELVQMQLDTSEAVLGIACFDLNGLKEVNDDRGHSAGDALICRAAEQLRQIFEGRVYRTGGDEFVVVDNQMDESAFQDAVQMVQKGMQEQDISCSVGYSWRCAECNIKEQFDKADFMMYQQKRHFYSLQQNDRRNVRRSKCNFFKERADNK